MHSSPLSIRSNRYPRRETWELLERIYDSENGRAWDVLGDGTFIVTRPMNFPAKNKWGRESVLPLKSQYLANVVLMIEPEHDHFRIVKCRWDPVRRTMPATKQSINQMMFEYGRHTVPPRIRFLDTLDEYLNSTVFSVNI